MQQEWNLTLIERRRMLKGKIQIKKKQEEKEFTEIE